MTTNTDKLAAQRATFEQAYEAYCQPAEADWFRREDDEPDEYYHVTTKEAWWGWCAALEAAGRVQQAEPVAVLRFQRDTPGHENDMPAVVSCNWLPDGDYRVYLAAPAERAPAPTVAEGRTDAEIEKLAIKHEAFGFGRVDSHGLTTHGFDPEGLRAFVRELLAAPTAQEASKPDGVKGYAMALNEVALQLRQRYAADLLSTPLWTEFEKRRNKFAQSISQPAQPSPEPSKPVQAEAASAHDWHHLDGRIKALMEQVGLPNSLSLRQAFSQLVNEMSVAATSKGTGNG